MNVSVTIYVVIYGVSWALVRQWAGHDAAVAQREAEIVKLEWQYHSRPIGCSGAVLGINAQYVRQN